MNLASVLVGMVTKMNPHALSDLFAFQKMIITRKIIYAKDIMLLTGRSRSYAYKCLKLVKKYYGKSKHQLLTIQEFAEYHDISVDDLSLALIGELKSK